jgi:hypothetical protein
MWASQRDDLASIGWIGDDLLITRHGCVKNNLSHRLARGSHGTAMKHSSILKDQYRRNHAVNPSGGLKKKEKPPWFLLLI